MDKLAAILRHLTDEERSLLIRSLDQRCIALRGMYHETENHRFKIEHARTQELLTRVSQSGDDIFARYGTA